MQPITLVLDSADCHALKRALTTEREELAELVRLDVSSGGPMRTSFKDSLDHADALLSRLDALALEALKGEHGTMDHPLPEPPR